MPRTLTQIDDDLLQAQLELANVGPEIVNLQEKDAAIEVALMEKALASDVTTLQNEKADKVEVTELSDSLANVSASVMNAVALAAEAQNGASQAQAAATAAQSAATQAAADAAAAQAAAASKADAVVLAAALARIASLENQIGGGGTPPSPPVLTGITPESLDNFLIKSASLVNVLSRYNTKFGATSTATKPLYGADGVAVASPMFDPVKFRALKVSVDKARALRGLFSPASSPTPAQNADFLSSFAVWDAYLNDVAAVYAGTPAALVSLPEIGTVLRAADVIAVAGQNF